MMPTFHVHIFTFPLWSKYSLFFTTSLTADGANVGTLVNKAKSHSNTLLVVKDSNGSVFGALITEQLKMGEREKYYGNGTIGVWSFATGALKVGNLVAVFGMWMDYYFLVGMLYN